MRNISFLSLLLALLTTIASTPLNAGNFGNAQAYETGFPNVTRLAADLHRALEPKHRQILTAQPVKRSQSTAPFILAEKYSVQNSAPNTVLVPESCVTLVNYLSHAKAMDEVRKGYLNNYLKQLAAQSGDKLLLALPQEIDSKAWSLDTLNLQRSNFNQIMGALVAIDMAHHYLGHYTKYASHLQAAAQQGKSVPINSFLTRKEWHEAVLKGARNALDCGLGVEGLKSLLVGLEKMDDRPEWTLCFSPLDAKISKATRELQAMENNFFLADY